MKAAAIRHPTCEKDFVLKAIKKGIRLDGRQQYDYRTINVGFGQDFGCCEVMLGDTRVLAQASCELVKPPETRPTEGQLFINVELSPMASPAFENGRMSDLGIEINRIIERCLKESRSIDLESLCLIANEKVWCVRVDVLALNDAGNLLDCCCIGAISALAHFRYPDVTVTGTEVIVHTVEEKQFVPLRVHHMPISNTFGFIENGEQVILDPEEKEECIISGALTIASNMHSEICCAQLSGGVSLDQEQILQCAKIASVKATEITEIIKARLEEDNNQRLPAPKKRRPGLKDPVISPKDSITKTIAEPTNGDLTEIPTAIEEMASISADESSLQPVENLGRNTAAVGKGKGNTWVYPDSDEDSTTKIRQSYAKQVKNSLKILDQDAMQAEDESDSEEEETMILANDLNDAVTVKPRNGVEAGINEENNSLNGIDISVKEEDTTPNKPRKKKKKKRKPVSVTT